MDAIVLQNCEILHSVQGLYGKKKKTASHSVLFNLICVMYVKNKRLFTCHQICWQYFIISKLAERKKFGLICFPGLVFCNQEPLWLLNVMEDAYDCYFLGVHIRLDY